VCNNYAMYMLPCDFTLVDLTAAGVANMSILSTFQDEFVEA